MDERSTRAKNLADRLIAEFYDDTAQKDWAMWGTDAVTAMERLIAALSHKAEAPTNSIRNPDWWLQTLGVDPQAANKQGEWSHPAAPKEKQ